MLITHEEAHKLIQYDADHALSFGQKKVLNAHLKSCRECQEYANGLRRLESALIPLMQRTWKQPHLPLSMDAVISKGTSGITDGMVLATRIAAVGMIAIAFLFSVWTFTGTTDEPRGTMSLSAPPVPTPSAQTTSTNVMNLNCAQIHYIVQRNDTLESIADRFSVSKEEMLAANRIQIESLNTGMELVIPECNAQPTGTLHATKTIFTPLTSPTFSTPDG